MRHGVTFRLAKTLRYSPHVVAVRHILWAILAVPFVMLATSPLPTWWGATIASLAVGACLLSAWAGAAIVLGALASLIIFQ